MPKRRLISLSAEDVDRTTWQEVIPEGENVLESVSLFGESFYCQRLANASSEVVVHDLSGREKGEVELPGLGSVGGFVGAQDAEETFFSFTNYVTPTAIYRVDLATGATTLWRQPRIDLDRDAFVTEQIFATSKDGTKVPVMITRRRETRLDGKNRTLLYGYGGFNISITPSFSPATAAWVDSGGIYAVANLRGGGEFGRQWHEAGNAASKAECF